MFLSHGFLSYYLPQNLRMYCFPYQGHSSPRTLYGSLFLFLRSLIKCLWGLLILSKSMTPCPNLFSLWHIVYFLLSTLQICIYFVCISYCLFIICLSLKNISSIKVKTRSILLTAVSLSPSTVLGPA